MLVWSVCSSAHNVIMAAELAKHRNTALTLHLHLRYGHLQPDLGMSGLATWTWTRLGMQRFMWAHHMRMKCEGRGPNVHGNPQQLLWHICFMC